MLVATAMTVAAPGLVPVTPIDETLQDPLEHSAEHRHCLGEAAAQRRCRQRSLGYLPLVEQLAAEVHRAPPGPDLFLAGLKVAGHVDRPPPCRLH